MASPGRQEALAGRIFADCPGLAALRAKILLSSRRALGAAIAGKAG